MSSWPRRILIIKPSSLGDIVHALPVLAALRDAHPDAHIAWLANRRFVPLLENHPLLNEVIGFDRSRFGRMWRSPRVCVEFWRFVAGLRRRRFDLALDLQGLIRSGLLALFSGAGQRWGFADAREGARLFYTHRVACPPGAQHAVERNCALLRALGVALERPEFPLALTDPERSAARELLTATAGRELEGFIAIVPGARWSSKRWPPESFARLIERLAAGGYPPCVLRGSGADRELAATIRAACAAEAIDLTGRANLRELVGLLDLAGLVICHDSGPMHIAAALGKPIVAIFGPTNPRRTGPYCDSAVIATHPLPCAPCYRRTCPHGHHDCLRRLDVDEVVRQVEAQHAGRVRQPADAAC